jgi:hypothetical protein
MSTPTGSSAQGAVVAGRFWRKGQFEPLLPSQVSPVTEGMRDQRARHCDIVETGNESWRFKNRA